ncbi:hypothetical protein FHR23_001219 [Stakelama sediminis]|uniref:Uncharacterized protein n=1 Tax=Stakelama sediminis TaxID=463200 RepID=A0A840YXP7_9SPHN|nr:hypothetical protein [Stakelama sediminis]
MHEQRNRHLNPEKQDCGKPILAALADSLPYFPAFA